MRPSPGNAQRVKGLRKELCAFRERSSVDD